MHLYARRDAEDRHAGRGTSHVACSPVPTREDNEVGGPHRGDGFFGVACRPAQFRQVEHVERKIEALGPFASDWAGRDQDWGARHSGSEKGQRLACTRPGAFDRATGPGLGHDTGAVGAFQRDAATHARHGIDHQTYPHA